MTTTPKRVQQRRGIKGWRKPGGAVSVAPPHKWGNPFNVGEHGITDAENAVGCIGSGYPARRSIAKCLS
jgi:hypothetical protein